MTKKNIWQRAIIHVDMNAFFASIEQLDFPELRGRPIGVTNGEAGTCIITCSYEARLYGIKTGMRVKEAKQRCSHFILRSSRPHRYADVSNKLMAALQSITPDIEIFSVDEAFLDITRCQQLYGHPIIIAKRVKQLIYEVSGGLSCSIGLSGDKTTAKFAAKQQKPDGFTVIEPWLTGEYLKNVLVTELCGVGEGIGNFLSAYGARTCGEVAGLPISLLAKRFGNLGRRIWLMCQGQDPSPVKVNINAPKSMGHGKVLPPDTRDKRTLLAYLLQMSEKLAARLRRNQLAAQTFFIGVKSYEQGWIGNKFKLATATQDSRAIYGLCKQLLADEWSGQGINQIQLSALDPQPPDLQLDLFAEPLIGAASDRLNQVVDKINATYGQSTLTPARLLTKIQAPDIISPAWKFARYRTELTDKDPVVKLSSRVLLLENPVSKLKE